MAQRTGKQQAGGLTSVAYGLDGDPAAVAIVQRIFAEFCHPYLHATLSEIAKGLNLDEIPTKRRGRWHASTVRYILNNDAYAPAVVSEEMYNRAQQRLRFLRSGPPK